MSRDALDYGAEQDSETDWRHKHIFFNQNADILDRFLEMLDQWGEDKRLKSGSFREMFLAKMADRLIPYYQQDKKDGLFSRYDVVSDFHSALKWDEVVQRLNMIQDAFPKQFKRITIRRKHYFEAALDRSVKNGHADDFTKLTQAAQRMDAPLPKKPYARMIRLQLYYGVARSAEMLDALQDYLTNNIEEIVFSARYERLITKLCRLTPHKDREQEDGCFYKESGRNIPKIERSHAVPQMMAILGTALDALPYKKDKKYLLEEVFGRDKQEQNSSDYHPMADTLRVINNNKDMAALTTLTAFWVERARPFYRIKSARQRIESDFAETAFEIWHSHDDPAIITNYIAMVKGYNPDAAKEMLNEAGKSSLFGFGDRHQGLKIVELFLEVLSDEDRKNLERPAIQAVFKHFKTYEDNRHKWQDSGLPAPDTREVFRFAPTNFDPDLHKRLVPAMKHYASLEGGGDAEYHAMKLAILFPTINKASRYLNNHAHGKSPVHDACLFSLPQDGVWDKEIWANLAVRWGNGALRWLPFAPQLEAAVETMNEGKHRRDHFKLSECKPADLRQLAHEYCSYQNKHQDPALAEMLFDHGVPEKYYDESLSLTQAFQERATLDVLDAREVPSLTIDGAEIGHPEYILNTLPQGDPRNLWMGQFVNSCMHLANEGRNLALAMFQEPHAAAYVIQRKGSDDIVASFHTWMSKAGNIVLNTWQPKTSDHNFLRDAFVKAIGQAALGAHPRAERVVMGQGRLKENDLPYQYIKGSQFFEGSVVKNGGEVNREGSHYTFDTIMGQFIIAERRKAAPKPSRL